MFGVMIFGTHILGDPLREVITVWVEVCKDNTIWVDSSQEVSSFVPFTNTEQNWTTVDPQRVTRVRCIDAA